MMEKKMRLDRFLVEMGRGTRSQIKEAARKGRIQVNGQTEKKTDRKIDPNTDQVVFDGADVSYQEYAYYLLNKPQGVVSATEDGRHRTVLDLLGSQVRKGLFPVGRLDIDTEGLLILTNDGDLAHRLLSPKKHVDKQYFARVAGFLPPDAEAQMGAGMILSDGTAVRPGRLEVLVRNQETGDGPESQVLLTIQEGKFHQVKRMFEALDCRVTYLKRLSMGPLRLDEDLAPGQFRPLTQEEIQALQDAGGGAGAEDDLSQTLSQAQAVLFDLDGTLVDSMWMWKAIDIEYLGRYGLSCPDDLQRAMEGMSFSETAAYFKETFQLPDSIQEIKDAWEAMSIEKYRNQVPLKKGARRFLEYLKARKLRAGIATSNGQAMVDAVLDALELRPYFQVVTTACEVKAGKPAPDIYLEVARRLGVSPDRCLVFEDVPAGIQAGLAAGMKVCAVEDRYSAKMREEKLKLADYFIEDFDEIVLPPITEEP